MRTIVQAMNEVMATPMVTAVMAATTERDPSDTHDAVSPGLEMNRIPTMTGATSARTPRRRITAQGYAWSCQPRTDRSYHGRQAGSTPFGLRAGTCPSGADTGGSWARPPCYTPAALTRAGRAREPRRSTIALAGRIGRPERRPSDQPMAILRREMSISIPDPEGLGSSILAARWSADAGV